MDDKDIDQDALASEWGMSLDGEGEEGSNDDAMAAQWAAMIDEDGEDSSNSKSGGERILGQEEIDGLLGFNISELIARDQTGIRALIDSAMVSYERLPMLEIVYDRLVRLMTTSLRNFTRGTIGHHRSPSG